MDVKPTAGSARFLREVDLAGSEEAVRHLEENCAWAADLANNDAADQRVGMLTMPLTWRSLNFIQSSMRRLFMLVCGYT